MTKNSVDIAQTYMQLSEAEKQALALEKMLDDLDSKMDSILEQIEHNEEERKMSGNTSDSRETH